VSNYLARAVRLRLPQIGMRRWSRRAARVRDVLVAGDSGRVEQAHALPNRSKHERGLPYGGVDAGGTTWNCLVGFGPSDIKTSATFPTTTPEQTISRVAEFFLENGPVAAVGVGSFGPIDLRQQSPTWGHIRMTPKQGWVDTNVAGALQERLGVPVAFDTDANAATLGEYRRGAATNVKTFCYMTVGTGIGAGIMVNGGLLHGLFHPEVGHMFIPHDRSRDPFDGACPYHGDCLEGLASGEAIRLRWGTRGEALDDPAAWDLIADYIGMGIINIISMVSPELIVLGGGVMEKPGLLPLVRSRIVQAGNGYFSEKGVLQDADNFIVPPGLGSNAGAIGALELARDLSRA
jgi:fructokinase